MGCCKELEKDIGFLIKQIDDAIKKKIDDKLARYGLTSQQCRVLFFIVHQEEHRTTQRQIEQFLGVTHPTVAGVIRRLEEKGFVETTEGQKDRRLTEVSLTERSMRMFSALGKGKVDMERQMFRGFSASEREELFRLLRKIQENVKEEEEQLC